MQNFLNFERMDTQMLDFLCKRFNYTIRQSLKFLQQLFLVFILFFQTTYVNNHSIALFQQHKFQNCIHLLFVFLVCKPSLLDLGHAQTHIHYACSQLDYFCICYYEIVQRQHRVVNDKNCRLRSTHDDGVPLQSIFMFLSKYVTPEFPLYLTSLYVFERQLVSVFKLLIENVEYSGKNFKYFGCFDPGKISTTIFQSQIHLLKLLKLYLLQVALLDNFKYFLLLILSIYFRFLNQSTSPSNLIDVC